jgi:uncharacterized membrane protein HdeD (DUF308 family)
MNQNPHIRAGNSGKVMKNVRSNWGWLLAFGILSMVLGFVGLSFAFALSVASAFLFGILLVIGSVGQGISCFKEKGLKGKLWHAMVAALYLIAGIALLQNPVGSILLTAVLGGALIAAGVFRILTAFSSRQEQGWVWIFISGVITLILGGIIISQWPVSGLWVIGVFIAVDLIVSGWAYMALALAARSSSGK